MSKESGKKFILDLKNTIDNVAIYSPTGKYGKDELDVEKTKEEKMEKLLFVTPSDPDEILEYVFFCQSLSAEKSSRTLNHLQTMIDRAKIEFSSDETINAAVSIVNKMRRKRQLNYTWRICVTLIGIGVYIWGFTTEWHWFWKIIWGVLLIYPVIIAAVPLMTAAVSDKDNLFD